MFSSTTFTCVFLIASSITSAIARPGLSHVGSSLVSKLSSGDGSGIPPIPSQCNSQCTAITSAVNACSDDSCLCTAKNMDNLKTCLSCVATVTGDVSDSQAALDDITGTCNQEGFKVPNETLGGSGGGGGGGGNGSGLPPIPSQCDSQCASFASAVNACSDDSCLCTATNMDNLKTCLSCVASVTGDTSDAQKALSETTNACDQEGFKVPNETLGGSGGGGGGGGGNGSGLPPIPSQCDSQCASFSSAVNACSDDSCLCTATNMDNLRICLTCVASVTGDSSDAQKALSGITNTCDQEGFKVPNETVGGNSGGGGSASPVSSGGSAAPTFSKSVPSPTTASSVSVPSPTSASNLSSGTSMLYMPRPMVLVTLALMLFIGWVL